MLLCDIQKKSYRNKESVSATNNNCSLTASRALVVLLYSLQKALDEMWSGFYG